MPTRDPPEYYALIASLTVGEVTEDILSDYRAASFTVSNKQVTQAYHPCRSQAVDRRAWHQRHKGQSPIGGMICHIESLQESTLLWCGSRWCRWTEVGAWRLAHRRKCRCKHARRVTSRR